MTEVRRAHVIDLGKKFLENSDNIFTYRNANLLVENKYVESLQDYLPKLVLLYKPGDIRGEEF